MKSKVKNKVLAKTFLENDLNATKTMRVLKPHITNGSAKVYGSKMLNDVGFQRALKEVMEEKDITSDSIAELLKRNMSQENNLPASNTAIDTVLKVRGDYAPEKRLNLHANLSGEALKEALKDKIKELKELSNA